MAQAAVRLLQQQRHRSIRPPNNERQQQADANPSHYRSGSIRQAPKHKAHAVSFGSSIAALQAVLIKSPMQKLDRDQRQFVALKSREKSTEPTGER
jgi:hypothetical protein